LWSFPCCWWEFSIWVDGGGNWKAPDGMGLVVCRMLVLHCSWIAFLPVPHLDGSPALGNRTRKWWMSSIHYNWICLEFDWFAIFEN
jgi:hypothetical protein